MHLPDTPEPAPAPGPRLRPRSVAAAVAALAVGAWLIHDGGLRSPTPPPQPAVEASASPDDVAPGAPGASSAPAAPPMSASAPLRIRIRSIQVDAPVRNVGLDASGHLTPPPLADRDLIGWYAQGTAPGALGTAVAVGHVDNHTGPAVFYRLGLLHKGDTVDVVRADHRIARFSVDAVRAYPKTAFPDATVYAPTGRAELRLITCGGTYTSRTGYQANVVVFAHLTRTL